MHKDVREDFKFGATIGAGQYGVVRTARRKKKGKAIGEKYAIKSIEKRKTYAVLKLLRNEIQILREISHPNIVNLMEVYEDVRYIYLVMEHMTGGELFERII